MVAANFKASYRHLLCVEASAVKESYLALYFKRYLKTKKHLFSIIEASGHIGM